MKKLILIPVIIASVCMIALGFNTVEYMCHCNPPETWGFCWGLDILVMPFWYAYFFGGILPFASGFLLLGLMLGYGYTVKKKRGKKEVKVCK